MCVYIMCCGCRKTLLYERIKYTAFYGGGVQNMKIGPVRSKVVKYRNITLWCGHNLLSVKTGAFYEFDKMPIF